MDIDWIERTAPHVFEEEEYLDDFRPDGWSPGVGPSQPRMCWLGKEPVEFHADQCRICRNQLTRKEMSLGLTCLSCLDEIGEKIRAREL